jgi:pimeloyl-ACP methyl ester carboxylesterase
MPLIGCGGEEKEKTISGPTATAAHLSGFFDSDGVKIHYETFGEGKPIVLIHGFPVNLKINWLGSKWVETLQPIRWVVALDCRGHGESDKPHDPEAYRKEKMGGDVLRLMDHLGIEKADLLGYSMGSGIACHLLACHRERFTSVILVGIGDRYVLRSKAEMRADGMADAMLAEDPSQITNPIGRRYRALADGVPNNDIKALAAFAVNRGGPVDRAGLAAVDIPVLIVSAGNDDVMGRADELVAAIPGAELVVIADADHLVVFDQRCKERVVSFLERQ